MIADAAGAEPAPTLSTPLLAMSAHTAVIPRRVVRAVTVALRPFFLPPVVVSVMVALVAVDVWLVLGHGMGDTLGRGMKDIVYEPALLLLVVGLTALAGAFHELGHATASRYGGAEPVSSAWVCTWCGPSSTTTSTTRTG